VPECLIAWLIHILLTALWVLVEVKADIFALATKALNEGQLLKGTSFCNKINLLAKKDS